MSIEILIDRYCDAWSDPDPAQRERLLRAVWADGAGYTDPTVHACGAEELLAHIAEVRKQLPGCRVVRTSRIDEHHGVARFAWQATMADGAALPEGLDIAFLSADRSRIERIVGFFGPARTRKD